MHKRLSIRTNFDLDVKRSLTEAIQENISVDQFGVRGLDYGV